MSVLQPLAIATVCLLGGIAAACEPVQQPLGQYQAAAEWRSGPPVASDSSDTEQLAGALAPPPLTIPNTTTGSVVPTPTTTATVDAGRPIEMPVMQPTAVAGSAARPPSCTLSLPVLAERKPLDMYIVVDANITLQYSGLKAFVLAGLRAFVLDPTTEGIGVGLRFFGNECDPKTYAEEPTVEVDRLPNNRSALLSALSPTRLDYSSSPMAPALQGGITHQETRSGIHPEAKQIVVLASDGFTQDLTCSYSSRDLENIAASGMSANPKIETYIVGFGAPPDTMIPIADDVLARFSPLDSIASAGGTNSAITLKYGTDATPLYDALVSIRRSAQPCEFALPQAMDANALHVFLQPSGRVPRVAEKSDCGARTGGFYLSPSDAPTSIMLCPTSCTVLQSQDDTVWLIDGCPSSSLP